MKKVLLSLAVLLCVGITEYTPSVTAGNVSAYSTGGNVVLRRTQKLRSSDGREIYLYTSGKCELYDGDRLEASCHYYITNGNEVHIYDDYGNAYKATISWGNGGDISSLRLSGTVYYQK